MTLYDIGVYFGLSLINGRLLFSARRLGGVYAKIPDSQMSGGGLHNSAIVRVGELSMTDVLYSETNSRGKTWTNSF
ncbi:uncharacterized protein METZ01_LOCUS391049 [marine metagenome]|uniref:Uncharacterized protein n=1 Tax=marine metagenome TaxID=408172 RepID=A0A382UWS2_9ZZZZ